MSSSPRTLFQGKFILKRLLGKGGFGEVYAGVHVSTGENVAIKLECTKGKCFLFHEARVMQEIQISAANRNAPGVPQIKFFGKEGDYRILVMSIHGSSLEDLRVNLGRLSLKTVAMLADEMISRLEFLHSTDYIHRDLKPDNFLLGIGKFARQLYLIDFGLCVRYRSSEGTHKEMETGKTFLGTSRFAAMRTHQGLSQSRRDDMEQLVYILIYLYRGRLPWSGLRIKDREEKERVIGETKRHLPTNQICLKCPRQFEDLLVYTRKMEYTEEPQYAMCRLLMSSVLDEMNVKRDYIYDWVTLQKQTMDITIENHTPCDTEDNDRVNPNKLSDHKEARLS